MHALITGGLGGLGSEIKRQLQNKGINCLVTTSRPSLTDKEKNIFHWDMTEENSSKNLLKELKDFEIGIFIHSAHIFSEAKLALQIKPEKLMESVNNNLKEIYSLTLAFSKKMNRKKNGSVCIIGSYLAINPTPGKLPYIIEKNALQGMVLGLQAEFTTLNFNIIHPGLINTDQIRERLPEEVINKIGVDKLLNPKEVSEKIINLVLHPNSGTIEHFTGGQVW